MSATPHGYEYLDPATPLHSLPDYMALPLDHIESEFYPTFTDVTFAGAWTNFGGVYEEASYARLGHVVRLRGAIKHAVTSTTGTIFTLPIGFRPAKQRFWSIPANTGFATVTLQTNGIFSLGSYQSGGNAGIISLEDVSWDLAA